MNRVLAAACIIGMAAAGCTGGTSVPGGDELRVGTGPVASLDPLLAGGVDGSAAQALAARQIFEGLTSYDPATLEVRPAAASSWTVSPDARMFTFMLRPGLRFHDGTEVRAADVVASLERLASSSCAPPESAASAAPAFLLQAVTGYSEVCRDERLAGVQALDEQTVQIELAEPWADLPSALGHPAAAIALAGLDPASFGRQPVGTGPYRVAEPWDGTSLRLERAESYKGGPAAIASARLVGYSDPSLAYLDLLQDELHLAAVPRGRIRQARREFGEDGFAPGVGLSFLGFNLRSQRVAPLAFRHGLSRAVDRESLATAIFEGTRDPAEGILHPVQPGVEGGACAEPCRFDPDEARRLITEAYPDGSPEILLGVSAEGANPAVGDALVGMFSRVGVIARVVERPLAEHLAGAEAGDVDAFLFAWIPSFPAPDAVLSPLFRSGARDNRMAYGNPDVDHLLAQARVLAEAEGRYRLQREAEAMIVADAPIVPLLWYRSAFAVDPAVRATDGVLVDGLGLISFAGLELGGGGR